ncbi:MULTISPECIES: hypothetical protein [Actinomadura]|uniref:Uncharacterized protein n=1 Tax=Actinomadura litoris TaxID=2678616 RepID=A0A7K1L0L1_9ACTN|nr:MULTISPECIES: hypothetical protein [Actinomadura]MBT2206927.1 hypothetical protein [Actinomadura sp. NEAU-AAG7]MUN37971.1 hypothetical protein [Actinomadura litoris]
MSSESDQQPARVREPAPDPPTPPVTEVTARPAEDRQGDVTPEEVRERLRRRAIFLRELAEARELRRRVTPHRSRRARIHAALRRRTFRLN